MTTSTPDAPPSPRYSGFGMRMLAHVIDTFCMMLFLVPIFRRVEPLLDIGSFSPENIQHILDNEPTVDDILSIMVSYSDVWAFEGVIMAIIVVLFWRYKSATPGKMILNIAIVDAYTLGPAKWWQPVVRYFGYAVSFFPLCLGFVWIHYDKRHQGWHDKLARTVVIFKEKDPS